MPDIKKEEPGDMQEQSDDLETLCPERMTLELIIDSTGEFEHLNELIMLQVEKCGGFKSIEDYFKIVTPTLDLLEVEIRVRYTPGTTKKQMKLVIQDWIDNEISGIRKLF